MLALHHLHRPPTAPPAPAPAVSAAELFALARQLDRAAIAIDTRSPGICPVSLLRLLEEDLVQRAAAASVDEFLLARATASLRRPRRWGSRSVAVLTAGRWPA